MASYDRGDLIRVSATFTNQAGAALDPTAIVFKFTTPAAATTIYTYGVDGQLVRDSIGNYHVDVNANAAGRWRYRYESTGTGQAAAEGVFLVDAGHF